MSPDRGSTSGSARLELRVLWLEFKLPAPVDVRSQIWQLVTTGQIVELLWVSARRSGTR